MATYESGFDPKYGYNHNAFATKTLPMRALGVTNRVLASGIGLVSEALHERKDGKKQPAQADASGSSLEKESEKPVASMEQAQREEDEKGEDVDRDERDWDLDDATADLGNHLAETSLEDMDLKPPSYNEVTSSKLAYPVVLPQRRPGTKTRGFVRAYAPALENCGIDQKMFLAFLKDLHTKAQAKPIFQVTLVAANIAGVVPEPTIMAVTTALQIAAAAGQEAHERYKTNTFLDKMNEDLFKPRGLYCLIVKYKPGKVAESEISTETVDIGATALAKFGRGKPAASSADEAAPEEHASKLDGMKAKMQNLRVASGEAHESEMPVTCATLVFPGLDAVQDARYGKDPMMKKAPAQELQDKGRNASKFVGNYFDRRAQAIYNTANPNSTLTQQASGVAPQFRSSYADPNNHTNKHFITLITGGKVKAEPLGAKRRWEKAQRKAAERQTKGLKDKPKKRFMQEDVLYLSIVNLPTEEELQRAHAQLAEAKGKKAEKKRAAGHGAATADNHQRVA